MPWTPGSRRALCNFIGSALIYLGCAAAAMASHHVSHAPDKEWGTKEFWYLFAAVQLCWAVGYCMSSLPKWGKWVDGQADTEYKLTVIVGLIFAFTAGNLAYYLTFYEANVKHLYSFVAALAGGFAGEKWLAPFLMRLLPVASAPSQNNKES